MTLTREQILAMPAGAELDFLVAVHVMGFIPTGTPDDSTREKVKQCWRKPNDHCLVSDPWQTKHEEGWFHSWRQFSPSHVIDHAWQVVEKMCPLMVRIENTQPGFFSVDFFDEHGWESPMLGGQYIDISPECESVPLGICHAALLTKLKAEVKA